MHFNSYISQSIVWIKSTTLGCCDFTQQHFILLPCRVSLQQFLWNIMTTSNGNIFRVTGPLRGESTSGFPSQRPVRRSVADFLNLHLNKWLSKQSRRRWFEMPSRSLWRHCNDSSSSTKHFIVHKRSSQQQNGKSDKEGMFVLTEKGIIKCAYEIYHKL